jgi:hypothetical protein
MRAPGVRELTEEIFNCLRPTHALQLLTRPWLGPKPYTKPETKPEILDSHSPIPKRSPFQPRNPETPGPNPETRNLSTPCHAPLAASVAAAPACM